MSTRAIIRFFDSATSEYPFAAMYEQCNGYPEGLGADLQAISAPFTDGLVAGAGAGSNGMPCFAATVVAKRKCGVYSVYLCDPREPVSRAGYTYDLRPSDRRAGHVMCRLWGYDGKTIEYDGLLCDAPWSGKSSTEKVYTLGEDGLRRLLHAAAQTGIFNASGPSREGQAAAAQIADGLMRDLPSSKG